MKSIITAVMVTIYYSKIFYYYAVYCTRQNFHGTTTVSRLGPEIYDFFVFCIHIIIIIEKETRAML